MPIVAGGSEQLPDRRPNARLPQGWPATLDMYPWATIAQEIPNNRPICYANWDEIPPEEQERIMLRYRFMGIRLRSDLKEMTVPIARDRMELP